MDKERCEIVGRLMMLGLLRRAYLQRAAKTSGLYFGQLPVLQYIDSHDGCPQREIAEQLGVTPASIALSTKRMAKVGLLEKETDHSDLRCNKLHITALGRKYMTDCGEKFAELDARMFEGCSDEELAAMSELLRRVIGNLHRACEAEVELTGDWFSAIRLTNTLNARERELKEDTL